jgi:hypothetical protein
MVVVVVVVKIYIIVIIGNDWGIIANDTHH